MKTQEVSIASVVENEDTRSLDSFVPERANEALATLAETASG